MQAGEPQSRQPQWQGQRAVAINGHRWTEEKSRISLLLSDFSFASSRDFSIRGGLLDFSILQTATRPAALQTRALFHVFYYSLGHTVAGQWANREMHTPSLRVYEFHSTIFAAGTFSINSSNHLGELDYLFVIIAKYLQQFFLSLKAMDRGLTTCSMRKPVVTQSCYCWKGYFQFHDFLNEDRPWYRYRFLVVWAWVSPARSVRCGRSALLR